MKIVLDRFNIIKDLCRNKRVLDVGAVDHDLHNRRKSVWLHGMLRECASSLVGVDYDASSVSQLQREGYNAICADAVNFDLGQTFDIVMAGELIEHLPNPAGFLACAKKHLSPTGQLVLTTPNAQGMCYCLQNLFFGHELENPDHVCFYTPRTLACLLRKCGFEMISAIYIAGMRPQGHDSRFFYFLALIKNIIKLPLYFLRPSFCHRFLVVARLVKS